MLTGPGAARAKRAQFAKLKKLVEPGENDASKAFTRLAEMLKSSGEQAEIQIDLVRGRTTARWTVALEPKAASAAQRPAHRPDVRLLVAQDTWQRIAEGELSPIGAFLAGELRIRGDTDLAKRLLKKVVGPGETDVCR